MCVFLGPVFLLCFFLFVCFQGWGLWLSYGVSRVSSFSNLKCEVCPYLSMVRSLHFPRMKFRFFFFLFLTSLRSVFFPPRMRSVSPQGWALFSPEGWGHFFPLKDEVCFFFPKDEVSFLQAWFFFPKDEFYYFFPQGWGLFFSQEWDPEFSQVWGLSFSRGRARSALSLGLSSELFLKGEV